MEAKTVYTARTYLVAGGAKLPFMVGVTEDGYPIMLTPPAPDPPPTDLITEIFLEVFTKPDWIAKNHPKLDDIKMPRIGSSWLCALVFFDKHRKLLHPEKTEEEASLIDGDLRMMERLLADGAQTHWFITPPRMPLAAARIWDEFFSEIIIDDPRT